MTYVGRVNLSYGPRQTRLERLRALDEEYLRLKRICELSQILWERSGHTSNERLHACSQVLAALTTFACHGPVDFYMRERVNDLLVALGELLSGRSSVLLSPSPVHSSTFSMSDLMQQGTAQVCVDLLRNGGATAAEARNIVAQLFEKHRLPKFGEAKLRTLGSRLKGPGSTQDRAFDLYEWASAHAEATGVATRLWPANSVPKARRLADKLIGLCKKRDHRRDFFFATDADSSANP